MKSFLTTIVISLLGFNVFSQSLDQLHRELSLSVDTEKRIVILKKLAEEYMNHDLDVALDYINEGIVLCEEETNSLIKAEFHHLLGNVYLSKGFLINARENYHIAQQIFKNNNAQNQLVKTRINLAILYQKEEKFKKAEELNFKIIKELEENEEIGYKYLPTIYLNLGSIYDNKQDPENALQSYYTCLKYCKDSTFNKIRGRALHNIGNQYIKIGRLKDARYSIEEALKLKKEIDDQNGIVTSLNILGNIYRLDQNFKEALPRYLEALEIAEDLKSPLLLRYTYNNLAVLHEEKGDHKTALQYFKEYKNQSDFILKEDFENHLEQYQKETQLQQESIELQNEKELQQGAIIVLSILLILVFVIAFLILRFLRLKLQHEKVLVQQMRSEMELTQSEQETIKLKNEKLQNDISFRDRELTTNIMHLMQKYELINGVSEELMKLYDVVNNDAKKVLRSIVFNLQSNNQTDVWKELEIRFEQVNQEFYDKLNEHYPKLSSNEKKLCAYLYLNLSTKDISSITHQSTKSIEVARFRLRKKLNLTNTETDYQTFFREMLEK
ncbi:tetratricopeptide repeat protein [Flammeovirga sp. MY04]|uniref:tetratricopeptide repeat protein n=1 Tax=Flammeovirga sp. MY04 TaxID=1191459 RepID=UPI000A5D52EC|nr:tetratricopeptide repeat protein [Flammeovirga sp. MY04]ANQ51533.2 tetratricopeptide repeat protein [Flammeovirga sp. MY04]